MKKINVFLMLVMLLLSFSAEARKVKLMVSPEDAEIYIDNQFVGTGTFEMIIKNMPVVYRIQKTGYFTHESKVMPYDKRNSISITLREDKYFISSTPSGLVNKYITVTIDPKYHTISENGNLDLSKAWRLINNVLLNYFDEFSASDYHGGYLQTPWAFKDYGEKMARCRVTVRDISSVDLPAFQIKVSSEIATKVQAAKDNYQESDRIPTYLQPMIEELQTRIGGAAKN